MYFDIHADHWSENFVPEGVANFQFHTTILCSKLSALRPGKTTRKIFLNAMCNFTDEEIKMTRKAKQNGSIGGIGRGGSGGMRAGGGCKWVNVKLSDEDVLTLERSDATMEYLAGCLLGLADNGFNVSVKVVDEGDSIMACIIRPSDKPDVPDIGISSFASNVRDAVLGLLYKFENILGGILEPSLVADTRTSARFR